MHRCARAVLAERSGTQQAAGPTRARTQYIAQVLHMAKKLHELRDKADRWGVWSHIKTRDARGGRKIVLQG